jgi:hypothetical protein
MILKKNRQGAHFVSGQKAGEKLGQTPRSVIAGIRQAGAREPDNIDASTPKRLSAGAFRRTGFDFLALIPVNGAAHQFG